MVLGCDAGDAGGATEREYGLTALRLAMGIDFVAGTVAERFGRRTQGLLRGGVACAGVAFRGGLAEVLGNGQGLLQASDKFVATQDAADGLRASVGGQQQALVCPHRAPAV
ncbi:hypothetical protein D9M69_653780 [compost metagenome]